MNHKRIDMRYLSDAEVAKLKAKLNPALLEKMAKRVDDPNLSLLSDRHLIRLMLRIKVEPNGCWNWLGPTDGRGYGSFSIHNKTYRVTRLLYAAFVGPLDGLNCCHTCDNPSCCNTDHIFLGDQYANMRDCRNKNRFNPKKGDEHARALLRSSDIPKIRALLKQGITQVNIGALFGVKESVIANINQKRTWAHIPD